MQNALAILSFPLAPVQSAPSDLDPAPTTQDFAVTFAADLTEVAADTPVVDPDVIATDQPAAWVVPILPVSGVLPVGVQAVFGADGMTGDIPLPAGVAVPNADPGPVPIPVGEPPATEVAEEDPTKAVDFAAAWLGADVASRRASEGAIAADTAFTEDAWHPGQVKDGVAASDKPQAVSGAVKADAEPSAGSRIEIETAKAMSPEGVPPEAPAALGVSQSKQTPTAAVLTGMHDFASDRMLVGEVVAQATVAEQLGLDQMTEDASPVAKTLVMQPVDAMAASPMLSAIPQAVGKLAQDEADLANLAQVHSASSDDQAPAAAITLPGAETDVAAARTLAPPLLSEPRSLASFWERYLANGVEPQPGSELLSDAKPLSASVVLAPASLTPGAVGLTPLLAPGKEDSEVDTLRLDDIPASTGSRSEVIFNAPSTYQAPSPVPLPRLDQVSVLTVLPWIEPADLVGDLDIGATQSFLSPLSTPAASPGAGGSLSLPVQMVALQLAGVLVQASDRVTELALAPEELGKVRLRMEQDAANPDRLTILINVERPETLDLFRRHAGELAEAIRNAGYSGAQIDFGHQGQDGGAQQDRGRSSAGPDLASDEVAPIQHSPRMMAGATLDLRL